MNVNWNLPTIITTDAEPDDVAALHFLLPALQNKRLLIVVGEHSNVEAKCECLYSAFAALFEEHRLDVQFMKGVASTGDYPQWSCLQKGQTVPYAKIDASGNHAITRFINASYQRGCNVIALKPPRDLLAAFTKDNQLFSNCYLYMSGSFNLRKLILECEYVHKAIMDTEEYRNNLWTVHALMPHCMNSLILFLERGFKSAILFETHYAIGSDNTMTADDMTDVRYHPDFHKAIRSWNDHIYLKKLEDLKKWVPDAVPLLKIIDEPDFLERVKDSPGYRALKVIHSIRKNRDVNLILADVGLAVCMTRAMIKQAPITSVRLSFDFARYYTTLTDCTYGESRLYAFEANQGCGQAYLRNCIIRHIIDKLTCK